MALETEVHDVTAVKSQHVPFLCCLVSEVGWGGVGVGVGG